MKRLAGKRRAVVGVVCRSLLSLVVFASSACAPEGAPVARTPAPASAGVAVPRIDYSILGRIDRPDDVTWTYDDASAPVGRQVVEGAIRRALSSWEASGLVRFRRASGDESARLVFAFHGDDMKGCPPFIDWLGQVGHAGGSDTSLWVHLDIDSRWTEKGEGDSKSLDATILHELGHVLGLGHSRDERAVMHERYDAARVVLGDSDLAALTSLYGIREPRRGDVSFAPIDRPLDGSVPLLVLAGVLEAETPYGLGFLDLDGDRRDEFLLWERRSSTGNAARIFRFDERGRLIKTLGPFIGIFPENGEPLLGIGRETNDRVLIVPLEDEWCRVFSIDVEGRPIVAEVGGGTLPLDHLEWTDDEGKAHRITELIPCRADSSTSIDHGGSERLSVLGRPFGGERLLATAWR